MDGNNAVEITVTFYSKKLFITLDLNMLFTCLFKEFDKSIVIRIEEMSDEEKVTSGSTSGSTGDEIRAVDERFHIFVHLEGQRRRRQDIEDLVQRLGRK
jgi:hypothetical protein